MIDLTKDIYEMPRFPINEKYGKLIDLNLTKTLPFQYKKIEPEEKYIKKKLIHLM